MPTDVVQIARELLAALASNTPTDGRADQLISALGESIGAASPASAGQAMALLASGLGTLDPESAGVAARVVGAMIEAGHDARPARASMVGTLQVTIPVCVRLAADAREQVGEPPDDVEPDDREDWLAECEAEALREVGGRRPAAAESWQRLHEIWPGAIALLSVDPEARAEARELAEPCQVLQEVHEAAGWLRAMLCVFDDEPYVAIDPATRTGIVGRMSGIVENFQLNVLLMDEFPRDEPRVSKEAVEVARGSGPQQLDEQITGAWNLFTYAALTEDGGLPDPADLAHSDTWIWHEGMPADIPVLDGHRVILLGPSQSPRSWQAQRMFLALPARLTADLLDEAAVDDWLARIGAAAGSSAS